MGARKFAKPVSDRLFERAERILRNTEFIYDRHGCWNWPKYKDRGGYGVIILKDEERKSRHFLAHRLSFEVYRTEIPEGYFVCHHCDNPSCCNPDHLWVGTDFDNAKDRKAKGRERSGNGRRLNWPMIKTLLDAGHAIHEVAKAMNADLRAVQKLRNRMQATVIPVADGRKE